MSRRAQERRAEERLFTVRSHLGHRFRVKDKTACEGLDGAELHEALEQLFYEFIPRRNTNETAHALLEYCGSLRNMLCLPGTRLCRIRGVGPVSAAGISGLTRFVWSRMEADFRGMKLFTRQSFLAASDFRLNFLSEPGGAALLDAGGRYLGWLPLGRPLGRLFEQPRGITPDHPSDAPPIPDAKDKSFVPSFPWTRGLRCWTVFRQDALPPHTACPFQRYAERAYFLTPEHKLTPIGSPEIPSQTVFICLRAPTAAARDCSGTETRKESP